MLAAQTEATGFKTLTAEHARLAAVLRDTEAEHATLTYAYTTKVGALEGYKIALEGTVAGLKEDHAGLLARHETHYESKWLQNLDLRCVLLSDPAPAGTGGPNQNTSRIQYNYH